MLILIPMNIILMIHHTFNLAPERAPNILKLAVAMERDADRKDSRLWSSGVHHHPERVVYRSFCPLERVVYRASWNAVPGAGGA